MGSPVTPAPIIITHNTITVVRDDLFPGGTKARFLPLMFEGVVELVYASPAEGGAQTAIATVARNLGKRATIFVAQRGKPHARTMMARRLGAKIVEVPHGYLNVVQSRARVYCEETGATLAPFGLDLPHFIESITESAKRIEFEPDEVWCAGGSGVLARGLSAAWPNAEHHVVQVGRTLSNNDVAGGTIHIAPLAYSKPCPHLTPFPSDPHYDAKAWTLCSAQHGSGKVLFWNVTGPAQ